MPRKARIYQRATCYHLVNRGINKLPIFDDDADRRHFSKLVIRYKAVCDAHVYHWAWMGNHYHMLVAVAYENLRAFIGGLQQAYVQYHHMRHETSGVFWQGRFFSKPVEIGKYLVACGRYIERNPPRKGMVSRAWDYKWSSAAAYVKQVDDGITELNPYLGVLTRQDRRRYGELLMSEDTDRELREYEHDNAIGAPAFSRRFVRDRGRFRIKRGRPKGMRVY